MNDVTNPLSTPVPPPAQATDGTLINQAAPPTASPPTDSSSSIPTDSSSTPPTNPKTPEPKDPSLLNAKPEGAPEKYSDFKLPDGFALKPEVLTEAAGIFKGLNLTQDQAQSLVDFHAKQVADATSAPYQAVTEMKAAWETEVRAEYGKQIEPGGKVSVAIGRAIDLLGPTLAPQFREAMDLTLAGSNPAFVRGFAKFAELLAEGSPVAGKGPSPLGQKGPDAKPVSVAQAMYPHLKSANDKS